MPKQGDPRRYRVHNTEGYVERLEIRRPTLTATNTYNYYRRDHLGNNCAVWDATNDTTLQKTVYYASGLPMSVSSGQSTQPYKYNGKEFIEMHGYDTYDYGWRGYYPAVGRFTTEDPLAEKYYSISPYVYCANNPMRYIDIEGKYPTEKIVDNGVVGSRFNPNRKHPIDGKVSKHNGQDLKAKEGNKIHAAARGKVKKTGYQYNQKTGKGWGNYVILEHEGGYTTLYAHIKEDGILVQEGSDVKDGQEIALSGQTGGVTGPHLHLEVRKDGTPVDPLKYEDLNETIYGSDETYGSYPLDEVVVSIELPKNPKPIQPVDVPSPQEPLTKKQN